MPGRDAVYFGADQPRITAEMLIPWSALGVPAARPPAPASRADVAMTSWYRERWMSLSGRPPALAIGDATGWTKMRLGDGVAGTTPAAPRSPG